MDPVMMFNKHERITIMTRHQYYTEEIKNELRANPFLVMQQKAGPPSGPACIISIFSSYLALIPATNAR